MGQGIGAAPGEAGLTLDDPDRPGQGWKEVDTVALTSIVPEPGNVEAATSTGASREASRPITFAQEEPKSRRGRVAPEAARGPGSSWWGVHGGARHPAVALGEDLVELGHRDA